MQKKVLELVSGRQGHSWRVVTMETFGWTWKDSASSRDVLKRSP